MTGAEPEGGFLARKAEEVRGRPRRADPSVLRDAASAAPGAPAFAAALAAGEHVAVIAEFKRRSPSGGDLTFGEEPDGVAPAYAAAGAAAVSVLTDARDFGGSLDDLRRAAASVRLPVLRKDFITRDAELYEARLAGAAAALLIVAMLDDAELRSLLAAADAVALECLVEVHDEREMERAAAAGARVIGVNNRDLRRLETDLATTERLAPLAPAGVVVVSESGIRTADDVARVRDAGAHAVLVGESLLRRAPAARAELLAELAGVRR